MRRFIHKLIEGLSPVKFFVITAGIFGLLFALTTPPFQGSDESAHFLRAFQISEGNFVVDTSPGLIGGILPTSIYETFVITTTNPVVSFHPNVKYSERKTLDALRVRLDDNKETQYDMSGTALYSPAAYIPAAAAISIGRLFVFPPVALLYLARIAGLFAWIVLFSTAIRFIPYKKWAYAFLGLVPMALFQASVLNTDAVTLGGIALLIAYILHLREQDKLIKRNQIASLLLIASLVILSKQAMFVFIPLLLLLPSRLFSNVKAHVSVKAIIIVTPLFLFGIWSYLVRSINLNSVYGSANGQDPSRQLPFIVHNPFTYLHALYSTIINPSGDDVARSLIGVFGWFDTALPWLVVIIAYCLISLLIVGWGEPFKAPKRWLSGKEKLLIIIVGLLYWGAVNTSLYLYYSPVQFHFVYGLQGRYYLPLLLLLVPLFYGTWLKYKPHTTKLIAILGAIFLLVTSFVTIFSRYFITGAK